MIISKRAAVVAALVGFALLLAGYFGEEEAQRKAFIEFLRTRIIDKPGLHIPIMSDQDVANFGPYADQYRIMNGLHHQLDAAIAKEAEEKLLRLTTLAKGFSDEIKEVRIVEIEGVTIEACGGTHVKNTNELKEMKITKLQNKGKNNRRMYFTLEG